MPGRSIRALLTTLSLAMLAAACAPNYYERYRAAHPDWIAVFPDSNASFEETLASVYAPPVADYQRIVSQIHIFEYRDSDWAELPSAPILDGEVSPPPGPLYGIAADITCLSEVALRRYFGNRVSWYLVDKDRLVSFDHYDFTERCVVFDAYEPTKGELIGPERRLAEIADDLAEVEVHPHHYYQKGLALVGVDRFGDAREMLLRGDESFDPSDDQSVRFDDPGRRVGNIADDGDIAALRLRLLEALEKAGALEAPPKAEAP